MDGKGKRQRVAQENETAANRNEGMAGIEIVEEIDQITVQSAAPESEHAMRRDWTRTPLNDERITNHK